MKQLNVQKYLRSGKTLDDLKSELGIKYSTYDDLVVLNYSQIDSPKTDPIVMECRSLVLQLNSWNIVSKAFQRFFNYGEALELTKDFNFKTAVAQEKVDGSIVSVFYHNNKWYMTTRGSIEGQGQVGLCSMSFRQLFEKTIGDVEKFYSLLNKNLIYIFELTAPENKVVKLYTERKLYLIGLRENKDFKELSIERVIEYDKLSKEFSCVSMPQVYRFDRFDELLKLHGEMNATDEGFVVVNYNHRDEDGNYSRIKVKNPAYVALAHMKESGGASTRCMVQLILLNEYEEFISYFPEYKNYIDEIKEKYDQFYQSIIQDISNCDFSLDRKQFAMYASKCTEPPLMFQMYDKKVDGIEHYISNIKNDNRLKNYCKNLVKRLKINDILFEIGE